MSSPSKVVITNNEDGGAVSWAKTALSAKEGTNADRFAVALDNAVTAKDSRAIIDILTKVNNSERMEIVKAYRQKFGKDIKFCKGIKFKPDVERTLRSLVVPVSTFLARELHEEIMVVDRDAVMEILCGLSRNQIKALSSEYEIMYGKPTSNPWRGSMLDEKSPGSSENPELVSGCSLAMDLCEMDAQEEFVNFCVALSSGERTPQTSEIDPKLVKADALALYNAGEGRYWWSDDENESRAAVELAVWIAILTQRSHQHLKQVFHAYHDLTKMPIEKAIRKQFIGDIRAGFLTLVKCTMDKATYFAERLHYSMKGVGTSEKTLTRVVVTNADTGFSEIKEAFKKKYSSTLEEWIADDTSGDYQRILLSIVNSAKGHAEPQPSQPELETRTQ